MRWSLPVSIFTVFTVTYIFQGIFAAPLDVGLEKRGRSKPAPRTRAEKIDAKILKKISSPHKKAAPPNPNKKGRTTTEYITPPHKGKPAPGAITANSLKKSSPTYRKAALSGNTYTKAPKTVSGKGRKILKVPTPTSPPKGKEADHILEAQTVAKALHKAGYGTKSKLGAKAFQAVKDRLNHHSNMAFLDADVNLAKGQAHRAALSGNKPRVNRYVGDYMRHPEVNQAGKDTAKKIDKDLRKLGILGVSVEKEHQNVLKAMRIKRELSLEELD